MFDFEGEKIKTAAKVLFVVGILEVLFLTIYFGWDHDSYRTKFIAWRFFLILIGGNFVNYLRCLLLSGIGSIIENVQGCNYEIESVKNEMTAVKKSVNAIQHEMTMEAE